MVEFGITTQFLVLNPKNKIQNLNQNANLATKNIKKSIHFYSPTLFFII